jgi:hypothetical protein
MKAKSSTLQQAVKPGDLIIHRELIQKPSLPITERALNKKELSSENHARTSGSITYYEYI